MVIMHYVLLGDQSFTANGIERIESMTPKEFREALCAAIGNHFNDNFPCFCGNNELDKRMNESDVEKANEILDLFS